jgi:hypothetical protein
MNLRRPKRKQGVRQPRIGSLSRAILSVLAERFCVRTSDLYRLVPQSAAKQQHHERSVRRSLKWLRDSLDPVEKKDEHDIKWGYIRSVPWSDPKLNNKFDYTCYVHGVTERGLRLVRQLDLDRAGQAKSFQEFNAVSLDHELRIIDLLEALESKLKPLGWELFVEQANIKASTVAPDHLMYLYNPTTNTRSAPIFLEYERQKRGRYDHGNPQVIRKLEAFTDHYDSELCQKEFGFRKFYVFIVLQSERKAHFLLDDLRQRDLSRRTFMVTSELQCQADFLGKILTTPKSETYSLLDL